MNDKAVGEQPPALEQGQPSQTAASTRAPSRLESLPAELRHEILTQVQDISDLKSLVHASPVLHQQYLIGRKAFLGAALKPALGNGLVDAYAVHTSTAMAHKQQPPYYELEESATRHLLDHYVALRSVSPDQLLAEVNPSEDDLAAMANFYLSVASPLVELCASIFLRNVGGDPSSLRVGNLSRTERARLLRALYRFELYCTLFGVGPMGCGRGLALPMNDILRSFFCLFRPWEIEEIDCVYRIIREHYETVFDAIQSDVARDNPRFEHWQRPYTPPGSFDLDSYFNRDALRQGTASHGLRVFSTVLRTKDHSTLVERMQKYMSPHCVFIEPILNWTSQGTRRWQHPSEEDRAEARRDRLPFLGDDEDAPPLAWVIIWRGRYSNEYGEHIDFRYKRWGYVFWDYRRLNESGAKKQLVRNGRRWRN
ncbi:hypothetical protein N658DRAFT_509926 [Parathielavia hyrcaniae]|uniref:Uncharacterized protein n=1 Tax=Parathielavia hyrcaniae TaxID=113614 RepID=A0AAN6SY09_9PEZI|nr:hypothetical protein N658DRAFT_509926 [Parathielavia hyrcaniae]